MNGETLGFPLWSVPAEQFHSKPEHVPQALRPLDATTRE
jgi:hypothetical protein